MERADIDQERLFGRRCGRRSAGEQHSRIEAAVKVLRRSPASGQSLTWACASASTWADLGRTVATAIHFCFMIGSVLGSPGVTPPWGSRAGAEELGGAASRRAGSRGRCGARRRVRAGAVLAQTFSESGPVNPLAVALSRKQTSVWSELGHDVGGHSPRQLLDAVTLSVLGSTCCRLYCCTCRPVPKRAQRCRVRPTSRSCRLRRCTSRREELVCDAVPV